MEYLHNVAIGLLLFFSSIVAGTLGLFHFSRIFPALPAQTTATTSQAVDTAGQSRAPSTITQQFEWLPISAVQDSRFTEGNQNIYFNGIPFRGASTSTFEIAAYNGVLYGQGNQLVYTKYAKDQSHVFYIYLGVGSPMQIISIPGADPATFKPIYSSLGLDVSSISYAIDKTHVYEEDASVPNADPQSFMVINNGGFSKDENHVYFSGQIVSGADPATFTVLNWEYSEDKSHVYCLSTDNGTTQPFPITIPNSAPETFPISQESQNGFPQCD